MAKDYRGLLQTRNREPISTTCKWLMWIDLLLIALSFLSLVGWGAYYGKQELFWYNFDGHWPLLTHFGIWTTNHLWTVAGALGLLLMFCIILVFGSLRRNRWRLILLLLPIIPLVYLNIMMCVMMMYHRAPTIIY